MYGFYFSFFIALSRISSTALKGLVREEILALLLSEKHSPFHIPYDVSCRIFSRCLFFRSRISPSILGMLKIFTMNGNVELFKCFYCIYWYDHMIFLFYSVNINCINIFQKIFYKTGRITILEEWFLFSQGETHIYLENFSRKTWEWLFTSVKFSL